MSGPLNFRAGGVEGRPRPKDRWRTPPDLYARLDAEFGFALDAACDSDNKVAQWGICRDLGDDALRREWHRYLGVKPGKGGAVWCNPPYSNMRPWLERGRAEGRHVTVVMLVPADTSTRWWRDLVAADASEVRFLTGRPKFHLPEGGEHKTKRSGGGLTVPAALVIYRPAGGPPHYGYMDARLRRQGALPTAADPPMPPSERATREALAAAERDGVNSSWAEGQR